MKKRYIAIAVIICLIVAMAVFFLFPRHKGREHVADVDYLNDVVDCNIMIYERDLAYYNGDACLKRTIVSDLNEGTLLQDHDYNYLIMDDRDGEIILQRETLENLIKLWKTHSNFNFIYVGRDKMNMISELMNDQDILDTDMSYSWIHMQGDPLVLMGTWDTDNQKAVENAVNHPDEYDLIIGNLAAKLISSIATDIRQSEK